MFQRKPLETDKVAFSWGRHIPSLEYVSPMKMSVYTQPMVSKQKQWQKNDDKGMQQCVNESTQTDKGVNSDTDLLHAPPRRCRTVSILPASSVGCSDGKFVNWRISCTQVAIQRQRQTDRQTCILINTHRHSLGDAGHAMYNYLNGMAICQVYCILVN